MRLLLTCNIMYYTRYAHDTVRYRYTVRSCPNPYSRPDYLRGDLAAPRGMPGVFTYYEQLLREPLGAVTLTPSLEGTSRGHRLGGDRRRADHFEAATTFSAAGPARLFTTLGRSA